MASHIPLIEDERVIGLDGKPLTALPINAWAGFPFEIHPHMRKGEVAHRRNPHSLIVVHTGSHGRSRIRSGEKTFDLLLAPGQVDVFSPGFRMDHASWDCTPGEVLAIDLDPAMVDSHMGEEAAKVNLRTSLATRDPVLERLAQCIRAEVDSGCMSGKLFAECLSLALLSRLSARYAQAAAQSAGGRKLSSRQLRAVVDFIEAHLGSELTVSLLAAELSMSAFTFSKLFKLTLELTPHRYVLSRRIERAKLLLAGDLPLSAIALAVGFANQSHFTESFRRNTGETPSRARQTIEPHGPATSRASGFP